jgi:hypothetical protein
LKRFHELTTDLHEELSKVKNISGNYGQLLKQLTKLQVDTSILCAKRLLLSPREQYYRDVFAVWTDKLGGELRISRNADTHKLGGPLVRFFHSVTSPVLATETPAIESISAIVTREKERRDKLQREQQRRGRGQTQVTLSSREPRIGDIAGNFCTVLHPLNIDPDICVDRQVHDYVVERRNATGFVHIVAVDADGTVVAHASGNSWMISLPAELVKLLCDPANNIIIHRSGSCYSSQMGGLKAGDIPCLGFPGLRAIVRHEDGRRAFRGALTSQAGAMLRRSTLEDARRKLGEITNDVDDRLYVVLHHCFRAGSISAEEANMLYPHLLGLTLSQVGILDYRFEYVPKRRTHISSVPSVAFSHRTEGRLWQQKTSALIDDPF